MNQKFENLTDLELSKRIYTLSELVHLGEKVINGYNAARTFGWTRVRAANLKKFCEKRLTLGNFATEERDGFLYVLAECNKHL